MGGSGNVRELVFKNQLGDGAGTLWAAEPAMVLRNRLGGGTKEPWVAQPRVVLKNQ